MKKGYSQKRFGLIGEKLGHTFSPMIHALLADYSYDTVELALSEVGDFARNGGFDGFNVTMPYKKTIMPFLDVISPEAEAIGAVNTVVRREGKLYGYNTDYFGFSYMLDAGNVSVKDKKALVLGRGGASATVCAVLRDRGAGDIAVVSSKTNTPEILATHSDAKIIVNATPVGMYPNNGTSPVDLALFPHCECVLDLIYNPAKTQLMLDAEARGVVAVGGLMMLVAQAVRAFELFVDEKAEADVCEEITECIEKQTKNIILIGMPGCGKSAVGRRLAERLERPFYDADKVFLDTYGVAPADVISADGEDTFRKMEHSVICELSKLSGSVIACGGGVVTREFNYDPLHQNGTVIFLERDLDKLTTRGRPLSQSTGVKALYDQRFEKYVRFADIRVKSTEIFEKTIELMLGELGL